MIGKTANVNNRYINLSKKNRSSPRFAGKMIFFAFITRLIAKAAIRREAVNAY
jgi:hypothetical protein